MGLDTYAGARPPIDEDWRDGELRFGLTDEDHAAFEAAEAELGADDDGRCIFSWSYFRGKLVSELVDHVTGVSLYREWIPPETVRFMAEAFEDCDAAATIREYNEDRTYYGQGESAIEELGRFFRICADR